MTTKAAAYIRQSQGSDDSVSLDIQRDEVPELAAELADDVDLYDLGVHTGFSINSQQKTAEDDHRLDANNQVQTLLDWLEDGEYDYLAAYDKSRLCRDGFVERFKTACARGGAEIVFIDDEEDDFARDIRHRAEQEAKQAEIAKARKAVQRRMAEGKWQGAAPTGFEWDDDGDDIEPGDDFDDVLTLIDLKEAGKSHTDAISETDLDISKSTVSKILDRRDLYEEHRQNPHA